MQTRREGVYLMLQGGGYLGEAYYLSATKRPFAPLPLTVPYRVYEAIFFQLLARCKPVVTTEVLCGV
jgi:hypothetical protein